MMLIVLFGLRVIPLIVLFGLKVLSLVFVLELQVMRLFVEFGLEVMLLLSFAWIGSNAVAHSFILETIPFIVLLGSKIMPLAVFD